MKRLRDIQLADQEKAEKLAEEFRKKVAHAFPKPYDEAAMAEIHRLRQEMTDLGFLVRYSCELNAETLELHVVVNLYTLKDSSGPLN